MIASMRRISEKYLVESQETYLYDNLRKENL